MGDHTDVRHDETGSDEAVAPAVADPGEPEGPEAVDPGAAETVDQDGQDEPAPDEVGADASEQPDWEALASEDPRSRSELLAELTEAEARRDEYLEDVRRARAEFENYRKRVMREGTAQRSAGVADAVRRLLDVLDDLDRTLEAAEGSSDEGLRKGVELVYGKLIEALKGLGLRRIDDLGAAFDPNRHEAVQQVASDEPIEEPVVDQILRPGYEIDGRVLRAAMVAVRQ